ncbi:P-element somatic inhibitor isoform X2 [Rhynchophorus ferrugineus]|uniref:K Homology domain-containing protein n=1 Tax=Rhynchophorus ferrugineus TaxID=354439 RepID=A0A834IX05_RHYFE|nr:hypothetical protein GWI33_004568 [Rhynchophorus ferrugineus]
MSDYSGVAPPQQSFNQSSAFAAALQRAKQIAAKINPAGSSTGETRGKRSLEDSTEPDAKKGPGLGASMGRPPQPAMGGPLNNGPPGADDMKGPNQGPGGDKLGNNMGLGGGAGMPGKNSVEIMIPGPKVGLIIGKGGETIKQLQEKSGAKMVVIQDGPGQELEKPLVISGDPQKIEYARQLVCELIAEKEMKNFNNRGPGGGPNGPRGRGDSRSGGDNYSDYGSANDGDFEILVPKAAVGVVIGKGGDMIKMIQADTGCRVQFQQARDEGPGDRRCFLNGTPKQVDHARQRIEELIDSVMQRDGHDSMGAGGPGGRGGRGGSRGGRGGGRGGHFGDRNGGGGDFGGPTSWNDRGGPGPQQEVSFTVPSNKCGLIIGRGGETIKQINQQSGAYCELDRRSNVNLNEKTFTIKGDPDCIEAAKRIISDKIRMPIHFLNMGGSGPGPMSSSMPTAYPGMAPQGYNPQCWGGMSNFPQQQWGQQAQSETGSQGSTGPVSGPVPGGAAGAGNVQVNPSTGQPDYSLQWAEYYRSLGMLREADMIEQQAKARTAGAAGGTNGAAPPGSTPVGPQSSGNAAAGPSSAAGAGQPDYSAQWAEYYRSIGKLKEAEAIENQMKSKQALGSAGSAPSAAGQASGGQVNPGYQQGYGGYQQTGAYYGGQTQTPVSGVGQQNYGFPPYGYGGQGSSAPPNPPDN